MSVELLKEKLDFAEKNPSTFEVHNVLDNGFVRLVDWLGDDSRVVQSARVSYGKGTKTVREDAGLIDYLLRHKHTSPFEQVVFTFHMKMPLFVFAQLVRHRTASLNAKSARYSVMEDEFYIPETFRTQSQVNKQGSEGVADKGVQLIAHNLVNRVAKDGYSDYEYLIHMGVAREQARMVLSQNLYTEFYWTQNLHNLFHLLRLRLDSHAQQEIRDYAQAIYSIIQPVVPASVSSWENHVLNGVSLSEFEIDVLYRVFHGEGMGDILEEATHRNLISKGYAREVSDKLGRILLNDEQTPKRT